MTTTVEDYQMSTEIRASVPTNRYAFTLARNEGYDATKAGITTGKAEILKHSVVDVMAYKFTLTSPVSGERTSPAGGRQLGWLAFASFLEGCVGLGNPANPE